MSSDPKKYLGFTFRDQFIELVSVVHTAKNYLVTDTTIFETVTGSLINGCVDN